MDLPFNFVDPETGEPIQPPTLTPEELRAQIERDGIGVSVFGLWLAGTRNGNEVRRRLVEAGIDPVDAEHALMTMFEDQD